MANGPHFDAEFQRRVVKLALEDDAFCTQALKHVTSDMFESDVLRWCWAKITRLRAERHTPTLLVLRDQLRHEAEVVRPRYGAMLDHLARDVVREESYVREALAEFIRRNLFVAAYHESQRLYNAGRADEAINLMRERTEAIHRIAFKVPDRGWTLDELDERHRVRKHRADYEHEVTFPTGITGVDDVLDGGLSLGEMGCWMADAKGGKSIMLIHLGCSVVRALRRNVLLVLLEGSRYQTENRIDAWFSRALYRLVKRGELEAKTYEMLRAEYATLKRRLVVRAFTDDWSYSAADIRGELDELRSQHGWVPDMIVVDYGDLLRSQGKAFSEEEHQRNAFSDLKALTAQDHGYAIWTAAQARRPGEEYQRNRRKKKDGAPIETDGEGETVKFGKPVLGPRDIADSYNKVRRVDFLGSINRDEEDRQRGEARLYCAVYRDNVADRLVRVKQDLARATFVDVLDPLNRPDMPSKLQAKIAGGAK